MERHEKIARAHRSLSWFYGGLALLLLGLALIPGSEFPMEAASGGIILLGLLFSIHYFTAQAAFARKPGARYASIAIGLVMLPGVPIGTIIGGYLLFNASESWDEPAGASAAPRSQRQAPTL